jgi:hypothetical protein
VAFSYVPKRISNPSFSLSKTNFNVYNFYVAGAAASSGTINSTTGDAEAAYTRLNGGFGIGASGAFGGLDEYAIIVNARM